MDREDLLQQLIGLTQYLGQPEKDYVILAEGNTSARIDAERFFVKASGQGMAGIGADGFAELRLKDVLAVLNQPHATDEDITQAYVAAQVQPEGGPRPSLETILHALAITRCGAQFVGHVHPLAVQALLCSQRADEFLAGRIFSEEVTFCGIAPAVMPYADPGLPLARSFARTLDEYSEQYGRTPRLVLIKNHGLVALGATPMEVMNITDMYVKVARVLLGTAALGGPVFLSEEAVRRIDTRPDELIRLKKLGSA
jgi:rhamnose utilization protein RhaD (predicted bifunctional aldolase and dehydrogenase)